MSFCRWPPRRRKPPGSSPRCRARPEDAALRAIADALVARAAGDRRPPTPPTSPRPRRHGTSEAMIDRLAARRRRASGRSPTRVPGDRRAARPGGRGHPGLHAAQRPRAAADPGPAGCRGDHLRGPSQRDRRRRGAVPEERQRGAAARVVQRLLVERRAGEDHARRRWRPPRCPPGRSSSCPVSTRDSVKELMRARGLVDVLIPRGGASLINERGRGVVGAGHRDGRGRLPRVRRRRRRPGHAR